MSCQNGVRISHLLFDKDSLLFCQAKPSKCERLMHILGQYEQTSDQAINKQKTALFFNPNTRPNLRKEICQIFGAQIISNFEKYLGLLMVGGKNKVNTFKQLHERIAKRVTGWKKKYILKAGREILIKRLHKQYLLTQ